MGANFETDTAIMNNDLKEIRHQLSEAKKDLGLLAVDISSLMLMWKGQASRAYFSTMLRDKNQIEEVLDRYSEGTEKLSNSGFTYERNERELVDMINSIKI